MVEYYSNKLVPLAGMRSFRQVCRGLVIQGLLLLASALSAGCGYKFRGSESALPPDVRAIYIPTVENNSTKLGLSTIMTEAIRDEFDSYGTVSVVDSQNEADAVLKVRILNVRENTGSTRSGSNTALQMQTTVTLAGELRRVTGPVLWRSNAIQATQSFGADSSVVVTSSLDFAGGPSGAGDLAGLSSREVSRGQEANAMASLASNAARQLYDKAVAPDF
jgi:outer membrane lipopolysaccharide assembly protein LptE/RlpB